MKVHVVTPANRALYGSELVQMHRLRHEIFVEELGWSALTSPDGLERDEFDDGAAIYLLAMEDGVVHGSLRLLPTWKRCMISERFAEWAGRASVPAAGDAWEWTRWCPGTARRPRQLIRARGALITAAVEFARSRGIETYYTFCATKFVPQLIELGWNPAPLGLPREFDEGQAIAVRWSVTSDQLDRARAQFRLRGPASFESPAFDPGLGLSAGDLERRLFASPARVATNGNQPAHAISLAAVEAQGRA